MTAVFCARQSLRNERSGPDDVAGLVADDGNDEAPAAVRDEGYWASCGSPAQGAGVKVPAGQRTVWI